MKIKIAFLITTLNTGGAEKQLIRTINLLDTNRYLIKVFVLTDQVLLLDELTGVEVEVLNVNYYNPIAIPKVLNKIRKFSPHILHSVMFASNLIARCYKFFDKQCKVVNHIHGLGSWIKKRHIILDRSLIKFVDKIIVISNTSKELRLKREKYPSKKLEVIYNSVDTNNYTTKKSNPENGTIVFGTASRLVQLKQVDKLLNLFKELIKLDKNIVLKIAGTGPEEEKLKELTIQLSIENNVFFLGNVTEMPPFYNSIDVFILYSKTEDMPLTIVEAFSSGLPVIAPNIGGIPELINNNDGLLLNQDASVASQVLEILEFLSNMNVKETSKKNRNFALDKFDSAIHKKSIENLYESLIK